MEGRGLDGLVGLSRPVFDLAVEMGNIDGAEGAEFGFAIC